MRKIVILIIMLLWTTTVTATASPILNDGSYITPIQENGSGYPYGDYVNSGNLVVIMPGNNAGAHFNSLNDYMGTNYGITLIPVSDFSYSDDNDNGCDCTGTWGATDTISFYAVKAGPNFALYLVDPTDNYGSWSTYDLWLNGSNSRNSLEVSHLTGYQASPVPIPGTVLLLGSGLLGLIGIKRKKLL